MKTTKGFTLIELLVVITIIGILATGASAVYTSAQAKARDAVKKSDLAVIRSALELTATDNGGYPSHIGAAATANPGANAANLVTFKTAIATYLPVIPASPETGVAYNYITDATTVADAPNYELGVAIETGAPARHEVSNTSTLDSSLATALDIN